MGIFNSTVQNLTFKIPESGRVFRRASEPRELYLRLTADLFLYIDDHTQKFRDLWNGAEDYSDLQFADVSTLWDRFLGGRQHTNHIELFESGAFPIINDNLTLTPRPDNPNSAVITSSVFGVIRPGISLADVAKNLGITEQQLFAAQHPQPIPTIPTPPIPTLQARAELAKIKKTLNEPGRFDYALLSRYPHLTRVDQPVWEQFIRTHPNEYKYVDYDTPVGDGRPAAIAGRPLDSLTHGHLHLTKLRIDVIGWRDDTHVDIIELKGPAKPDAIGQVLTYKFLWQDAHPSIIVNAVIIANRFHPDMVRVANEYGVKMIIVEKTGSITVTGTKTTRVKLAKPPSKRAALKARLEKIFQEQHSGQTQTTEQMHEQLKEIHQKAQAEKIPIPPELQNVLSSLPPPPPLDKKPIFQGQAQKLHLTHDPRYADIYCALTDFTCLARKYIY